MKKLLLVLAPAAALLSGCVAYPAYYGGHDGTVAQPGYVSGGVVYGSPGVVYSSPGVVYSSPGVAYPPGTVMRDRDGDGVPNRYDRRPANPYRY